MSVLDSLARLDLFVPLVAAHLLADFVLQTDRMATCKGRWRVVLGHVAVVVVASWILLGHLAGTIPLVLLVALLHLLIDLGKNAVERRALGDARVGGRPMLFLADQALHLLSLAVAVALIDRLPLVTNPPPDTGVWTAVFGSSYLRLLVLVSGWIVATTGAGYFFARFLTRFEAELEPDQKGGLSGGGYWIGMTERSLIYLFILIGEPGGIGFLAAAKSVFRIGELRESKDRKLAEYILIGTLLSFAAAMVVGLVTRAAWRAMP